MGFSTLLPCQRRRREKKKGQLEAAEKEKKGSASNTSPTFPSVETGTKDPEQKPPAGVKETRDLSTFQRVWNRAYDELADDKATSDVFEAYVKILLEEISPDGNAAEPAGDHLPIDMNDPVQRQALMKDAIQAGQTRIANTEKVTNVVGNVINFVNKFKGVIERNRRSLVTSTRPCRIILLLKRTRIWTTRMPDVFEISTWSTRKV